MKVLILCGVFAPENEQEVIRHARRVVEFSANTFQKRLIEGFRRSGQDVQVISAPFIGSFPNGSDLVSFRKFSGEQDSYRYVGFNNIWGIRNISRSISVKRAIRDFIRLEDADKCIVVYSAHSPFIEAARYAKRRDSRIRVCMYFPDLPHYMNMSADRSPLYDTVKRFDIAHMLRDMDCADAFVLLTEQMKDLLPVKGKPCLIREGIIDEIPEGPAPASRGKDIVYTGKLEAAFGVAALLEAFRKISDPQCRLVLCGRGDCEKQILRMAQEDPRIQFCGQVTPEQARQIQLSAGVLVNPRPDSGEYTKYSFPSKNVEYLLTGRPVAACMLSGMPEAYRDFVYEIKGDTPEAIAGALTAALEDTEENCRLRYENFLAYAREHLMAGSIARSIAEMCGKN